MRSRSRRFSAASLPDAAVAVDHIWYAEFDTTVIHRSLSSHG
ncbi:hypothetical protein [Amycolatopsis antarctica]|nr:hypothetical protein [Amycolatopsis antarctica]